MARDYPSQRRSSMTYGKSFPSPRTSRQSRWSRGREGSYKGLNAGQRFALDIQGTSLHQNYHGTASEKLIVQDN